ncbi:MAG: DUF222 domain-containing protein, partial [Actinomycetota bacterium]
MSQLRSILEELVSFDPNDLSAEELAAEITEACHGQQILQTAVAGWVKSLSDRGGHHTLGYSSPTAFLVDQTGVSSAHARRVIGYGNAAEKAPYAHQAWVDGRLSTDQARYLFAAAEAVPDAYPDAEEALVDIVEGLDAPDTRKAVAYWRQAMEGPGELDPATQQARRGLSASWLGGMLMVDGCLTRPAGEAFLAGLDANTPPRQEDDTRTPRQRRHDALENLARDWLDNGTTPTVGGEKPHIILHADIPALQGVAGGLHETENEDIVDIDHLRMVACDCSLTRIILGPDSEVLDVGRKTRVWTPAQRRAIAARDRHCQGPGCRAKPRHCDIHHTDHWADGGETTVDKGKLFCRPCHIQQHLKDRYHRQRRRHRT